MHVDNKSRRWSAVWVYAACLTSCGALLALAGVAFWISTDLAGPAVAHDQGRWTLSGRRLGDRPVEQPALVVKQGNLLSKPVVPVMISRVAAAGESSGPGTVSHAEQDPAADSDTADLDEWANYQPWSPDRDDTYKTVCVRLCDGAYFPISFATTKDRFKADAARCKSACGSPVRLFVGRPDGTADDLADVRGQSYADLANAFKYRTSYNAACTCKGQPWEAAELERHRKLAEAARQALPPVSETGTVVVRGSSQIKVAAKADKRVAMAAIGSGQAPSELVADAGLIQPLKGGMLSETAHGLGHKAKVSAAPPWRTAAPMATGRVIAAEKVAVAKPVAGAKRAKSEGVRVAYATVQKRVVTRPMIARLDESSMQRRFTPKEYWRLSYWDVAN